MISISGSFAGVGFAGRNRNGGYAITTACAGPYPATLPDHVTASEKRLEAALSEIRNLKPLVNNFYATLTDEQKNTASGLLILPGL